MADATKGLSDIQVRCPRCFNRAGDDAEECRVCGPQWHPGEALSAPQALPAGEAKPSAGLRIWRFAMLSLEGLVIAAFLLRLLSGVGAPPPAPPVAPVASREIPAAPSALAAPVPVSKPAIELKIEASGRLAEISAPDPRRALVAFCSQPANGGKLTPLALAQAIPQNAGERLGIVRDLDDLSTLKVVKIRRDGRTHRWIIGDASRPIALDPVPTFPPEGQPVPL